MLFYSGLVESLCKRLLWGWVGKANGSWFQLSTRGSIAFSLFLHCEMNLPKVASSEDAGDQTWCFLQARYVVYHLAVTSLQVCGQ